MDKKDIMYMVGALCIILIIALVIKPVMTGQPVNTGIVTTTPQPTVIPVTLSKYKYLSSGCHACYNNSNTDFHSNTGSNLG